MSAKAKIGLIAGSGDLAVMLAQQNPDMPIALLHGCADEQAIGLQGRPFTHIHPGQVGKALSFFQCHQVNQLIMAGGLRRPNIWQLWPDWQGFKALICCATAYFFKGDDHLLRAVRRYIEGRGFRMIGADAVLPGLTFKAQQHYGRALSEAEIAMLDPALAMAIIHARADLGQAVLAHPDGSCDCETQKGTHALIRDHARQGSILVKIMKPQQDPDLDRPVIGIDTVHALQAKGGAGIIVQSDTVFVLNREAVIQAVQEADMFIKGVVL